MDPMRSRPTCTRRPGVFGLEDSGTKFGKIHRETNKELSALLGTVPVICNGYGERYYIYICMYTY